MLILDLDRLFAARGITTPFAFLRKAGFTHNIAHRLLNNPQALRLSYIERLCTVLNCRPTDLFVYTPGAGDALPEDHQLRKLIRVQGRGDLTRELGRLSPDELNSLWGMIDNLKSSNGSNTQ